MSSNRSRPRRGTSLIALGHTAQESEAPLVSSLPVVQQLKAVGINAKPSAASLEKLLSSLNATGGYEQLMSLLYNATSAVNGYNAAGHYVRAQPLSSSTTNYSPSCAAGGCSSAHFQHDVAALPARDRQVLLQQHIVAKALKAVGSSSDTASPAAGLWSYLTGTTK